MIMVSLCVVDMCYKSFIKFLRLEEGLQKLGNIELITLFAGIKIFKVRLERILISSEPLRQILRSCRNLWKDFIF